ncbi:MAG: hypothetical protein RR413_12430 [Christensenellaceae bacterium]
MGKASNFMIGIAIALILVGTVFCYQGFDRKDNYQNYDEYSSINKNAYVGGDAYNYIINGTYFTGYVVLGAASYICSVILLSTGILLKNYQRGLVDAVSVNGSKEEIKL